MLNTGLSIAVAAGVVIFAAGACVAIPIAVRGTHLKLKSRFPLVAKMFASVVAGAAVGALWFWLPADEFDDEFTRDRGQIESSIVGAIAAFVTFGGIGASYRLKAAEEARRAERRRLAGGGIGDLVSRGEGDDGEVGSGGGENKWGNVSGSENEHFPMVSGGQRWQRCERCGAQYVSSRDSCPVCPRSQSWGHVRDKE